MYKEDEEIIKAAQGKTIASVTMVATSDESLLIGFDDGTSITISDKGQSCCESRYMTCDDDLNKLIGDKFLGVETRSGDCSEDNGYDVHETEFVEVKTSGPGVTLVTHNEHNGYYGGFSIRVQAGE